ncbi:alpha/beta-hydrolase [Martensiomyces pterosporus]|nr:alpha/beta-hydrolase [Martensiomyces pterosporus]
MLDHILGKPSANVRRLQTLVITLLTLLLIRRKRAPWGLRWLSKWDGRAPVWKALLGYSALMYLLKHMDDLLGLNAPEPLREYYSRSFYRTSWIFMALDAGFWTAMPVRPKPLRDVLSLAFSLYYLVFTNRGLEKVRKVRALVTVDHLRVSWNKGVDNPLLRFVRYLHSHRLTVDRVVYIPQEQSDTESQGSRAESTERLLPARCHVYYAGDRNTFAKNRYVVLNYPGGGFVSMGPRCHSDYLSAWADRTGAIIVSVDYAKAPEYPYPYAIDQCFEVYRELIQTNGRCIGLELDQQDEPLRIVLAGDSAGGNITASVMFRILESPLRLPRPEGIVFIYGCFNVDVRAWMTKDETKMLIGGGVEGEGGCYSKDSQASLSELVGTRDHLHHVSPLAVTNKDDGYQQQRFRMGKKQEYIDDRVRVVRKTAAGSNAASSSGSSGSSSDEGELRVQEKERKDSPPQSPTNSGDRIGYLPLTMTSSFTYFNDQVLTPEMMRAMVIMYVGPNGRPNFRTDYYLSPIVAPDRLLEQFPPVYFMCGEKDPMVDDTVIFAARIRKAKKRAARRRKRSSSSSGSGSGNGNGDKEASEATSKESRHHRRQQSGAMPHEYHDYKSSILYSRRHSQPRVRPLKASGTQFYIGSTDVSDNDDEADRSHPASAGKASHGGLLLPPSLRMSQFPQQHLREGMPRELVADAQRADDDDEEPIIIKVKLIAGMSHGFMQMYSLLPESKSVANTLGDWLSELLYGDHSITAYSRCASEVDPAESHRQYRRNAPAQPSSLRGGGSLESGEDGSDVDDELQDASDRWLNQSVAMRLKNHRQSADSSQGVFAGESDAASTTVSVSVHVTAPSDGAGMPPSLAASGIAASPAKSIFDRGLVDKHGIEVVSAANMVRRRGHGLADPLN